MGALRAEQDNSGEGRRRQGNVSAEHAEGKAAPEHLPRAQPPAQQDGRPPMGHGARVTSWGQGTSSANPLGFGKLRAVPQLGAVSPWCSRTPPQCLPPSSWGRAQPPAHPALGSLGEPLPEEVSHRYLPLVPGDVLPSQPPPAPWPSQPHGTALPKTPGKSPWHLETPIPSAWVLSPGLQSHPEPSCQDAALP